MNDVYFNMPMNSPRLAWEMLYFIGSMSQDNPQFFLRNTDRLQLLNTDTVTVLGQTSVRPACVVMRDPFAGSIILLSGTQGALHVPQLLAGWLNPGGAVRGSGACPAFENAALDILQNITGEGFRTSDRVRIFGYSYGGAVAQVLGDELKNNLRNNAVEVCSFACPRPGNEDFQRRMSRVPNVRWYCDDDPVRFMPPHVNEVPSTLYFLAVALWHGMDTQVQCPTGMQIEANGNITQTEGNPTVLHAVVPSIVRWITDDMGFQSVNHARETYMVKLQRAIELNQPAIKPPDPPPPERPVVLAPAQQAALQQQGEQDVVNSPTLALPAGETLTVVRTPTTSRLRYKRKKQGRLWVVVYDGVVVAVGPGKRRAGQLARSMNRAALVS